MNATLFLKNNMSRNAACNCSICNKKNPEKTHFQKISGMENHGQLLHGQDTFRKRVLYTLIILILF